MLVYSNILITSLNLVLLFFYFIFLFFEYFYINLEYLLIFLLIISLLIKLLFWYNSKFIVKKNLFKLLKNVFHNEKFTMLIILILSNILPLYMIVQRDSLVVDIIIEKVSFLFVFLFTLIGFFFEFFVLKRIRENEK